MRKIFLSFLMVFPFVAMAQCSLIGQPVDSAKSLIPAIEKYCAVKLDHCDSGKNKYSNVVTWENSTGQVKISIQFNKEKYMVGLKTFEKRPLVTKIILYAPTNLLEPYYNDYLLPSFKNCSNLIKCEDGWIRTKDAIIHLSNNGDSYSTINVINNYITSNN